MAKMTQTFNIVTHHLMNAMNICRVIKIIYALKRFRADTTTIIYKYTTQKSISLNPEWF